MQNGKISLKLPVVIEPVIRGLATAYLFLLVSSLVLSLIFYFTPLKESWMVPAGALLTVLALFLGGRTAAGKAGAKGLVNGLATGIVFLLLTLLFSLGAGISWSLLGTKSAYVLLASAVGGVFGVR